MKYCIWEKRKQRINENDWVSGCDSEWDIFDGAPIVMGWNYCPFCGKVIANKIGGKVIKAKPTHGGDDG